MPESNSVAPSAAYFEGWTKPAPTHPIARTAPQGMRNPRMGQSGIQRYSHADEGAVRP